MRIIAMLERSAGNESAGQMWTETKSFDDTAPLSDVIQWVQDSVNSGYKLETLGYRLSLNIDQESVE